MTQNNGHYTEQHCPYTTTKLYCLVTEAHVCVCEQLAQGYGTAAKVEAGPTQVLCAQFASKQNNVILTAECSV